MKNIFIRHIAVVTMTMMTAICPMKAQIADNFNDGDYTSSPTWEGDYSSFFVNSQGELQSKAQEGGMHVLSTESAINAEAEWTFRCRITTKTTAYNNLRFYIMNTSESPTETEGWYVQVGGNNKNITLRKQTGEKHETVINNEERHDLLASEDEKIEIRVTLREGVFSLWSKVENIDENFVHEGDHKAREIDECKYLSIAVRNTAKTGQCFYIDDIRAEGSEVAGGYQIEGSEGEKEQEQKKETIWSEQKSFSPDEDGYNDKFIIHYSLPSDGYTMQMRVFTADGILLYTETEEAGMDGETYWDGKTHGGRKAGIGVYVVYCELTNSRTGMRHSRKLTVTLTY